jgi:hypothetical protein
LIHRFSLSFLSGGSRKALAPSFPIEIVSKGLLPLASKNPPEYPQIQGVKIISKKTDILFFHPDYTVGFGIPPNQQYPIQSPDTGRGLYRR